MDQNSKEDVKGFETASARINAIIEKEIANGIEAKNIIIAGFSQGGALALHTALRSEHKLGGCIGLSTWLPLRADYPAALSTASKSLDILQIHGDSDQVVGYSYGKMSHVELKKLLDQESSPQFHTIQGECLI